LKSPGQPLNAETRAFFELRLGRDLADVRFHNDLSRPLRTDAARSSIHRRKLVHSDCAPGRPTDTSNFITNLDVDLGAGKLTFTWSSGTAETWPCTGHPGVTHTGPDTVGDKCSIKHTSLKVDKKGQVDGMAWFYRLCQHRTAHWIP
jgi:hypothetical protein